MQYTIGRTTRFRYSRSAGHHRKQRILFSRLVDYLYGNLGRYLYIVGCSLEREEKHIWRMFRHGFAAVWSHVWSWITRLWALVSGLFGDVVGDLFNLFIKALASVCSFV